MLNSLTGQKDLFVPNNPDEVTWCASGPIAFKEADMGDARTYISLDIMRRIMTDYFAYDIKFVMSVTDVDARITHESQNQNIKPTEVARKYESEFMEDMKKLNVGLPTVITRFSEYVPETIAYIEKIIQNGFAYA